MKVFLDTNIFLDMIIQREDHTFNEKAAILFKLALMEEFDFYVSPITVSNSFYITRKDENSLTVIKNRLGRMKVLPIDEQDVLYAMDGTFPDKEDAMQISCALRAGCDIIISRDSRHFLNSPVPMLSPSEFLSRLQ